MSEIELTLTVSRADVVVGEDIDLFLTAANRSTVELSAPDPERNEDWPKLEVRDLARGTSFTVGAREIARSSSHEFLPPPVRRMTTFQPGEAREWTSSLLQWVGRLDAGAYELRAQTQGVKRVVSSAAIKITVAELALRSIAFGGVDGERGSLDNCVYTHESAAGVTAFLASFELGREGPALSQSRRVAELHALVAPVPSISPQGNPYPAHWLAWLDAGGSALEGQYLFQARPGLAAPPTPVAAQGGTVVGAGLLDATGASNQVPARATVAVHTAAEDKGKLSLFVFEPQGAIAPGPSVDLAAGALAWGASVAMSNGEGRYAVALARREQVEIWALAHAFGGSAPMPELVARVDGVALAGAMALMRSRDAACAVLVRDAIGAKVELFQIDATGAVGQRATLALEHPIGPGAPVDAAGRKLERAFVDIAAPNRLAIVARTVAGAWLVADEHGRFEPLPAALGALGEPCGVRISVFGETCVVMAGAATGIQYAQLGGHGHGHG